jgi:serine/threonine-protein kinase
VAYTAVVSAPVGPDTLLPRDEGRRSRLAGLPPDLLAESVRRLRTLALLYAFVFFVSDPLTSFVVPDAFGPYLASPIRWAPSVISIVMALFVAGAAWRRLFPVETILALGLVFEVVGSYGIAAAQYLDGSRYLAQPPWSGLSWVAPWMLGFTVIVPSPPRRALAAALASVSAVPVVVGAVLAGGSAGIDVRPLPFFFGLVLPYLLVVLIAYVGARVVYGLGTELNRARELGSYRLVERLGQGGMGEVWRATHRLLARPAAVKLMRPEVLGGSSLARRSELRARFEREAQATASLRSPHTIELYDFGVADDGTFYYVMEFLDGFDLGQLVERFGPVPPERAVHLLTQMCDSLGEAHERGLVHRDVKPANVYLCRHGREADFVKVLDFGLVKTHGDAAATQVALTRDHVVGGTPAFMAPEQAVGGRPLDGRSDIYAVGCLAYWLVTGELVFAGRTPMEIVVQHTTAAPVPPSARAETPIPEALDRVILDCLAKDPDERPATADVLAARLAAIRLPDRWTPDRISRWWDVHHPAASRR